MDYTQTEMFAEVPRAREAISPELLDRVRQRLHATLARLEAEATFCWQDELGAIHEEHEFRAASQLLGAEGEALWAKFDAEMDRLYAAAGAE